MAAYVKGIDRKSKGMQRGSFLADDRPRIGAVEAQEFNNRLDQIDWSDHKTNTKITIKGSRVKLD